MKSILTVTTICFAFLASTLLAGTSNDEKEIRSCINNFSKAADDRDVDALEASIHKDFRVVANQLMGSKEISTMDRASYVGMLKEGKIGGDSREVEVLSIDVHGNNAMAKVSLTGKELTFTTYLLLVKNAEGEWKIAQDVPEIKVNAKK